MRIKELNNLMMLLNLILSLVVFTGCQKTENYVSFEKTPLQMEENGIEKANDAIKALPCFKCHIYERFMKEPKKGFFSHALHVQFEYHCNQCHSFGGHKEMTINKDICINCHGKVPEIKKKG